MMNDRWRADVQAQIEAAANAAHVYAKAEADGDRELSRRERAAVSEHLAEVDRLKAGLAHDARQEEVYRREMARLEGPRASAQFVKMTDPRGNVGSGWSDVAPRAGPG